jgi:ribosomal protein S18 acetylase RimI-like enzyme
MEVHLDNISKWGKLLNSASFPSLLPVHKKILARYGTSSMDEYRELIKTALQNKTVDKIVDVYNTKKKLEVEKDLQKEKENLKNKITNSIKSISDNTVIRMLTDDDEDDATDLYILFKETMGEDVDEAREYTQDFILKNIMYGIFIDEKLVGFIIIKYCKKFQIDFYTDKIDTFYIQELLIDPEFRGKSLSKYLIEYCIYRCPKNQKFISLMTSPDNIPLQKVAKSLGFVQQDVASGDSKHSLLMIKNMDHVENMSIIKSPLKTKLASSTKTRSMYPRKSQSSA